MSCVICQRPTSGKYCAPRCSRIALRRDGDATRLAVIKMKLNGMSRGAIAAALGCRVEAVSRAWTIAVTRGEVPTLEYRKQPRPNEVGRSCGIGAVGFRVRPPGRRIPDASEHVGPHPARQHSVRPGGGGILRFIACPRRNGRRCRGGWVWSRPRRGGGPPVLRPVVCIPISPSWADRVAPVTAPLGLLPSLKA